MKRQLATLVVALAGGAAVAASVPTAAAHADDVERQAKWRCPGGSSSESFVTNYCNVVNEPTTEVRASFHPKGEKFVVRDDFNNDRPTIGYLKVAGSGTARFKTGTYDLSFSEGKEVKVKVCTSSSSNAVCSGWSPAGST